MIESRQQFEERAASLIDRCTYPGFEFDLDLNQMRVRVHCPDGICNHTGAKISWGGRYWYLEPHMDDTQIVQTLFLAIRTVLEHEARELFRFEGQDIFNSHLNIHDLHAIAAGHEH